MAYPEPPEIATSYTAVEQALGDGTLPGQELDVDLASIRASVTSTIEFLKQITRSDGKLANGSVTKDSLDTSLLIGFDPPEPWATASAYTTSSTVFEGYGFYLCLTAHTSGVFATDLAAGRWQLLADLTPPAGSLLAANNLSDLTDASNARANLGLGTMATANSGTASNRYRTNSENDARFQPLDTDLTAIAGLASAADKVPYATGAGTWALADFTTLGRSVAAAANADAIRTAADAQKADTALSALVSAASGTGSIPFSNAGSYQPRTIGNSGDLLTVVSGTPSWVPFITESGAITLTGSTVNISTSLSSSVTRITVWFRGASLDAAGYGGIQLGTAGAFVVTGYTRCASSSRTADITSTAQFIDIGSNNAAANVWDARYDLRKVAGADWWLCSVVGASSAGFSFSGSGAILLAGPIDRIRAVTTAGNYDAGNLWAEWR